MTGYKSKRTAALDEDGMYLVHQTKHPKPAQPEQEPVACVYKATTKKGEIAHFGEYSAAKAWAGWGTVEQVPLKTLTLIPKSIKPCTTCEALARTVMLDQTSHDTNPPQRKPLTDEYQSGYYDGKKAALAGREWNFCERCGKRTADLTVIHTCTPPQENT